MADAGKRPQDSAKAKADAIALAEQAEAEAAEAEALAAAARARARAIKLRREAQAQADDEAPTRPPTVAEAADDTAETPETPRDSRRRPSRPTPPSRRSRARGDRPSRPASGCGCRVSVVRCCLAAATIVAICASARGQRMDAWHHHTVLQERQRSAAFVAAARQGVVNLTSLDFNKSKEDVQRVLDSATGEFRDEFQRRADDFASVVKDSKAVTQGSVAATAVESME